MSIITEYPVFEANQVLSYTHLNGLVNYLEQQDRLSRRKLIGIGIGCGLEVNWRTTDEVLFIGKGVAVTSIGHLICLKDGFYDRFLPYTLPQPSQEESGDEQEDTLYPFLHDGNGDEIEMWEMLSTDFIQEEGEPIPDTLTLDFLNDKVIMLFLECERESLKNCDINDCSDKGAKMTFDVRVLAVNENDALAMLQLEESIAELPVHQHTHPKFDLQETFIEKINPSRYNLKNFSEIYVRIKTILSNLKPELSAALQDSFNSYEYLLRTVYPENNFPVNPFANVDQLFQHVFNDFEQNVLSLQYLYDYFYDLVQGYNEFIEFTHGFEAECCPHPDRFPKHILLGKANEEATAFVPDPLQMGNGFDPLSAQTGVGPFTKPLIFRHYFIPSMIGDKYQQELYQVQSLHYRMYLSAFRYDTSSMMDGDIKITPSKDGDYQLSDKAIPFYYNFESVDDFHRNWNYIKTVSNKLKTVYSYQFTDYPNHPLLNKMEDSNFYRVEGHVGKGLATVMKNLGAQKRDLGLAFAIEPVFIGMTGNDKIDEQTLKDLMVAAKRLFGCKLSDLDAIFLILIAVLYFILFMLLAVIFRIGRGSFGMRQLGAADGSGMAGTEMHRMTMGEDFIHKKIQRAEGEKFLEKVRKEKVYVKGQLAQEISSKQPEHTIGGLYLEVNSMSSSSSLCDRTFAVVNQQIEDKAEAKKVADELNPVMSLIDNTEELMKSVSADSVEGFDFDLFETRYESFMTSYDNFKANEPSDNLKKDNAYMEAQEYTVQNEGTLKASGPKAMLGTLFVEFQKRFLSLVSEFTLPGFSKKHPGLEHKAGVRRSGTLVLLYAHRSFVDQELQRIYAELQKKASNNAGLSFGETIANVPTGGLPLMSASNEPTAAAVGFNEVLVSNVNISDPLDNFVVLGDFCLPDRCCDSDCSDLFDERPDVSTGVIRGSVTNARSGEPIPHAKVIATEINNNSEIEKPVDTNGKYHIELSPGTYNITAGAEGFAVETKSTNLSSGATVDMNFELIPLKGVKVLVVEIVDGSAGYDVNTAIGLEALSYYGARYGYYDAYSSKLMADARTDTQKKMAERVAASFRVITSKDTNLNKLNAEIKKSNKALVEQLENAENDKVRASIRESIKTINSAYLDKLSLVSKDKLTPGSLNTLKNIEKITEKSGAKLSVSLKDWTGGFNLSERPEIVKALAKAKVK